MFEQLPSDSSATTQPVDPASASSLADAIAAQIRVISTASNVGAALIRADHSITWANPALANLLGRTADDLVGMRFQDVTHPEDVRFDASLADLLFTGTLDTYQVRKRLVHRAGRAVPVVLSANVLRGPDNQILFALASIEPAPTLEEQAQPRAAARTPASNDTASPGTEEVDRIRRAMLG
jgi:PAS domain S-box-containing protein